MLAIIIADAETLAAVAALLRWVCAVHLGILLLYQNAALCKA